MLPPAGILLPQCSWLYMDHPFQSAPHPAGPGISGLRLSLLHLHTPDKVGACPNPQRVPARQGWGRGPRRPPPSTKVVCCPKKLGPAGHPAFSHLYGRLRTGHRQAYLPLLRSQPDPRPQSGGAGSLRAPSFDFSSESPSLGHGMAEGTGCTMAMQRISLDWRLRGLWGLFPGKRPHPQAALSFPEVRCV